MDELIKEALFVGGDEAFEISLLSMNYKLAQVLKHIIPIEHNEIQDEFKQILKNVPKVLKLFIESRKRLNYPLLGEESIRDIWLEVINEK